MKEDTKEPISEDSIYRKHPKWQIHRQTQRTDYWVPGAGEGREGEKKRECLLMGLGFLWG